MGSKALQNKILTAVRDKNYKNVEEIYREHYKERTKRSERNTIARGLIYLKNNFNAIDLTPTYGCAAEGHVSHVLSARLSSRPMGWSVNGALRMAKLRAYYFNGGDFHQLFCKSENTKENIIPYRFRANARHDVESNIPSGHVVGLDGITNGVSALLRSIVHGGYRHGKMSF